MTTTPITTKPTLCADPIPAQPTTTYQRSTIVQQALTLMETALLDTPVLQKPEAVKDYLRLMLGDRPHEVFALVYLNAQHQVIDVRELFRGTLTQTTVYPREVVIEALAKHAAAVILVHNHPSGSAEPSTADKHLTQTLQTTLQLVDIRVLDHFIVTRQQVYSFKEKGLM